MRRRGIMVIIRGTASSFHTIKHLHREERPFPFACYLFYSLSLSLSLFFFFFSFCFLFLETLAKNMKNKNKI